MIPKDSLELGILVKLEFRNLVPFYLNYFTESICVSSVHTPYINISLPKEKKKALTISDEVSFFPCVLVSF